MATRALWTSAVALMGASVYALALQPADSTRVGSTRVRPRQPTGAVPVPRDADQAHQAERAQRPDRQDRAGPAPQAPDADHALIQDGVPQPGDPSALPYAPAESIAAYIDLLDVDDFAARLNAQEWIYETPSVGMETILPYLMDPALSPEARSRLEAIGDVLFRVTSRAAMGVQFERQGVAPIIIRNAVRDDFGFFRAHEVIEAGDEVVLADGEPVETYDEFQAAILAHDPYEIMELRVRRRGELVDVQVPLGDYNRLGNGTLPPDHVLRQAWERRLERLVSSAPSPLTPVVDCRPEDQRAAPARTDNHDDDDGERIRRALVVAGGFSRGGVAQNGDPLEASPIELDGTTVEVRDYLRQQGLAEAEVRNVERQLEPLLAMHRQLMEVRTRCRESVEETRLRLADPTLDEGLRRALGERLARLEQNLTDIQQQLDAINMVLPLGR